MNRVQSRLFPIICCLALAGCVKPVDCTTMDKLSVGTATVQNAVALFGKPTSSTPGVGGSTIFKWESTTHLNTGGGTFMVVQLTFGQDGKLMDKGCTTVAVPPLVREPAG
jgi:hypothetical protein